LNEAKKRLKFVTCCFMADTSVSHKILGGYGGRYALCDRSESELARGDGLVG
jgi:hypothetical protein